MGCTFCGCPWLKLVWIVTGIDIYEVSLFIWATGLAFGSEIVIGGREKLLLLLE